MDEICLADDLAAKHLPSAYGGFARSNLEVGRTVDGERANHWFGFQQVPNCFMHLVVLGAVILFGILFGVPKALCENTIVFFIRDENCLVYKAFLFLKYRENFLVDRVGELSVFAWLGG